MREASSIVNTWEPPSQETQPAQVWEANIVARIVIYIRTIWHEVSHCLSSKGNSSPIPEGPYQSHIYWLQSGSQLDGSTVLDWLSFKTHEDPSISVCTSYSTGEEMLSETLKRKFSFSVEPEPIQLPDLEDEHDYVVIPVVLSTLPFKHIVVIIYERETNTLEFYDSKGYSLLDHGDVMIAGKNASLSNLFRAAYNKYCVPHREEGIQIQENITQHQFDKDACGVFVMDRIDQRVLQRKSWEGAQLGSAQLQGQILSKRAEFAQFYSSLNIDNREVNIDYPSDEESDEETDIV
jgi:hypothetical protein